MDWKTHEFKISIPTTMPCHIYNAPLLIFEHSTHYNESASRRTLTQTYPSNKWSSVANRLSESSLSPLVLTNPQRAYVVCCPGIACPFSSTCPMLIWTEAWSLAVMRRPVAALQISREIEKTLGLIQPFTRDVEIDNFSLILYWLVSGGFRQWVQDVRFPWLRAENWRTGNSVNRCNI
jgi:hypothetical protein